MTTTTTYDGLFSGCDEATGWMHDGFATTPAEAAERFARGHGGSSGLGRRNRKLRVVATGSVYSVYLPGRTGCVVVRIREHVQGTRLAGS